MILLEFYLKSNPSLILVLFFCIISNMHYPKNLTYPPHHPHELARRQAKCQERLRHHTKLAMFHGLIGFACLGLLFNYIQKDFPHKKSVLIPLIVTQSAALAFSKSSTSFLKRQKWIIESQRLQKY